MTDLDRQAAEFEALRAKRKSMTGPTNHLARITPKQPAAPSKAALEARAELATANRNLAATKAKLATAQAALANAARVALPAKATAPVKAVPAAPAANLLASHSDSDLQVVASHRSATEADRSAARAELEARGWTIHPSGSFSQSIRKQARR